MKFSFIIIVVIVLVISVGVFLYFYDLPQKYTGLFIQDSSQKYSGPMEKVTLTAYPDYAFSVYVAKEKGFFEKEGLDVNIKTFESGRLAMNSLENGEADIATAADFVFVRDSFDRKDIRIFSVATISDNTHELVARRDKGIENILDIKGKKIGVTKKSSGEFYFGNLLIENKLHLTDVELIDLKPSEMAIVLERGDIDAVVTWEPIVSKIKKNLGQEIVSFPAQGDQDVYFLLITRQEYIDKSPEVLERFTRAMIKTEEFIKVHPLETEEFMRTKFNYDIEYIQLTWQKFKISVELTQMLLLAMDNQARWIIANNLTGATEIPNYLDYIYTDALEKVKPEAITIIK